ncbi:MAG: S8 family serine peptidase, partial [Muribaculaceae bacterium]|nr:S8 family serine peptidase [Muribaculaceae bacterium]
SMASPVVTGAVALLKSKNKDLTSDEFIKSLTMTGRQTDTTHRIGPTIQLADALNATGGELLNFDDLMKDHNLLTGKWKSTHELEITNSTQGKIDDMWTYFIFSSPDEGRIEHHCIKTHRIYSAPLRVKWSTDRIEINQTGEARTPQGDVLIHDDFLCRPNKDRLLEAHCMRGGKEQFDFLLEKVN